MILDRAHTVLAANINLWSFRIDLLDAFNKVLFKIILLQVDERGAGVPVFGQKVKFINLAFIKEHFAKVPLNPFVDQFVAKSQSICNFQSAFCKTNCATAKADLVVVIQYDNINSVLCQINRHAQPNGACANHHNTVVRRGRCGLIDRLVIWI